MFVVVDQGVTVTGRGAGGTQWAVFSGKIDDVTDDDGGMAYYVKFPGQSRVILYQMVEVFERESQAIAFLQSWKSN